VTLFFCLFTVKLKLSKLIDLSPTDIYLISIKFWLRGFLRSIYDRLLFEKGMLYHNISVEWAKSDLPKIQA
jgi:hypothetical protein